MAKLPGHFPPAENGRKWQKMAENGGKWREMVTEMAGNDWVTYGGDL